MKEKTEGDKLLLKNYMKGFDDCPTGIDKSMNYKGLSLKAYETGWLHYSLNGDIGDIQSLSQEDILEMIKGE